MASEHDREPPNPLGDALRLLHDVGGRLTDAARSLADEAIQSPTGSFFERSDSSKMRTRFLHTGPTTRSLTRAASMARPASSGSRNVRSSTSIAAIGAG